MYEKFIANRITELRMKQHISEIQLSNNIDANDNYINQITLGKALPSMKRFLKMCEYFEITPLEFFDNSEEGPLIREATDLMKQLESKDIVSIIEVLKVMVEKTNRK